MKKILTLSIILSALFIYSNKSTEAIPNPWINCKDDISCGAKKAGFNLPLRVENYKVRAMKGMIEISFPYKKQNITIRKSESYKGKADSNGIKDISGNYNKYPINKTILIQKAVPFNVRGEKNKFYVANFAADTGYYSIISDKGLTLKDINHFYNLLEEAEVVRSDFSEESNYTIEQLEDLRRVDDIVEPIYTQDCFPKTLKKKGVTENCFERANLGSNVFCSSSELKMIKNYYKKGQDKDPLNDGSGEFCAN